MHVNRLDRAVVAVLGALVITGVFFAGTVSYDLDYELLGEPHSSSATGTNTVCQPYDPAIEPTAANLMNSISPTPTCVLKFDRASDGHIRYPLSIPGPLDNDHPCSLLNQFTNITDTDNFDLIPGEGYRVVLDSEPTAPYTITGDENSEVTVVLYKVGETTPDGVSNTGISDYCPPYNRAVDKASTLWNEIECPLGACSRGVCTQGGQSCLASCTSCYVDANCPQGESCHPGGFCTVSSEQCPETCAPCQDDSNCDENETCAIDFQLCDGGQNHETFCNRVNSISRFVRSSDSATTYTGASLANDFDLTSGESYRIQVKRHVEYIPGVFGVQVYIESQRPAPCGFQDGGYLLLKNTPYAHVDVKWHGGDPDRESGEPFTNLVFLPTSGPVTCGGGHCSETTTQQCSHDSQCPQSESCQHPNGTCANTCPVSGVAASCEKIHCAACGCEIIDGMTGLCTGSGLTVFARCEDIDDCPSGATSCALLGNLEPGDSNIATCNQVHCNSFAPGTDCGFQDGVNCCDNDIATATADEDCNNPEIVRCTELLVDDEFAPRFWIHRVSVDDGATWLDEDDLADRGVVAADPLASFEHRKCCEFYCNGEEDEPCTACTDDSQCAGDCVSACEGVCEGTTTPCTQPGDCGFSGVLCVGKGTGCP